MATTLRRRPPNGGPDMDPCTLFRATVNSAGTRRVQGWQLSSFCQWAKTTPEDFLQRAEKNRRVAEDTILKYLFTLRERMDQGKMAPGTVKGYIGPIVKFLRVNDAPINRDRVYAFIPQDPGTAEDRLPTREEKQRAAADSDPRLRLYVKMAASSGIRVGAVGGEEGSKTAPGAWMKLKHLAPIERGGKIVAARLDVYPWSPKDKHYTFISGEAWDEWEHYRKYREANGEKIGPESPIFRNLFQRNRAGEDIRPVGVAAFRVQIYKRFNKLGLGGSGFMPTHGFRKDFKTSLERAGVKSLHVEMLMGHNVGLAANYYRPEEKDILGDYLKAIPFLTILGTPGDVAEAGEKMKAMEERLRLLEAERLQAEPYKRTTLQLAAALETILDTRPELKPIIKMALEKT